MSSRADSPMAIESLPLRRRIACVNVPRDRIPDMLLQDLPDVYQAIAMSQATALTWGWSPGWVERGTGNDGDAVVVYVPLWDAANVQRAPWVKVQHLDNPPDARSMLLIIARGERL